MKLFELFDKPVQFSKSIVDSEYEYRFKVEHSDGVEEYEVNVEKTPTGDIEYHSKKFDLELKAPLADVSFSNETKNDGGTYSTINFQDKRLARIVFATVIGILKDYLRENPSTKSFVFGSAPDRYNLYKSLAKRFGKVYSKRWYGEYIYYVEIGDGKVNESVEPRSGKWTADLGEVQLDVAIDGASVDIRVIKNNDGHQIGYVVFDRDGNDLFADDLSIDDEYRGRGIAKIVYDYVSGLGYHINRSSDQTSSGKHFWDKNIGDRYRWGDME